MIGQKTQNRPKSGPKYNPNFLDIAMQKIYSFPTQENYLYSNKFLLKCSNLSLTSLIPPIYNLILPCK
jgi:hypothetical protein